MSVINQMLKDLDQRQQDAQINNDRQQAVSVKSQSKKPWLLIFLTVLILSAMSLLVWWQYQENNALRAQQRQVMQTVQLQAKAEQVSQPTINAVASESTPTQVKHADNDTPAKVTAKPQEEIASKHIEKSVSSPVLQQDNEQVADANRKLANKALTKDVVIVQEPTTVDMPSTQAKNTDVAPTLSITRQQLTPEQLITQKNTQAQQALNRDDVKKAEQLLEEVLLIDGLQHASRKQLAALWFGRKDYRSALNLLAQGVALAPENTEFPMLQARIYFQQALFQQALTSLGPIATIDDVEIQSFRATIAQQVGDELQTKNAYQRLTRLQPMRGKWWLGYAVALDRNGEFLQAKQAYHRATNTDDISQGSRQFIRQRLLELGE